MPSTLNIFTVCDKAYEDFIPLFILSNLTHVSDSIVEICVLDRERVEKTEAIKYVRKLFPNRIFIREIEFVHADKARFMTEVQNKTEYVYISDIDIITLRSDILKIHIDEMEISKLPYSNGVRKGTKRMTGLHFTKFDSYYPIGSYKFKKKYSDEELLYAIVKERNIGMPKRFFRPIFGIHMSPNRCALNEVGWEIAKYKKEWKVFRELEQYKKLVPLLSGRIQNNLLLVDFIINGNLL